MHNAQNVPVEVEETTYPIRVERYELIRDSGGPGRQCGGLGLRRDLRLLAPEARLTIHCDRVRFVAPGMRGGGAGGAARCTINPGTPRAVELTSKTTNVPLRAGDVVRFDPQGGGAYGPAIERDRAHVTRDVMLDKVSAGASGTAYGQPAPARAR